MARSRCPADVPRGHPPEFECRREVSLPATPEAVWEAVATTAGNAAWLFPNEIDPSGAGATVWDPPHHYAVRVEQGDWFNALEFLIEGRDGGTTVLRYAHSGIFVDNCGTVDAGDDKFDIVYDTAVFGGFKSYSTPALAKNTFRILPNS